MIKPAFIVICLVSIFFLGSVLFLHRGAAQSAPDHELSETAKVGQKVAVLITYQDRSVQGRQLNEKRRALRHTSLEVKYELTDSVVAFINPDELKELESQEDIVRVDVLGTRSLFLQDSVPLVNGTQSYPLVVNGVNLTGAGQSICILDTGISYTHADLGGCFGNNSLASGCKVVGGYDFVNNDNDPIDDHGHGTHVAGIAAANGSLRGVAPGARIIAQKVCNSAGSCSDADIIAAMSWCIGNVTTYNISVISMSFGSGLYSSYCNSDPLASYINQAVGKNISVVIAAGNSGSATQISAPGCVQNATRAGSIRKDDATIDYNRNNLVNLLAPGYSINSTYLSSSYATLSGTSMATPHVSGALAVLSQFLSASGRTQTPRGLELTLNATGRRIADSSSGLSFARINLYAALISLDTTAPMVTLTTPINDSFTLTQNQTFECNASDLALENATFYLWNSSGALLNQTSNVLNGSNAAMSVTRTNISYGTYYWNCLFTDRNNNQAFASANFSLVSSSLVAGLQSPTDGLSTNQNQTFECNASSGTNSLVNGTLYIWNSTGLENITTRSLGGLGNNVSFNYEFKHEGTYVWNCLFEHNASVRAFASSNYSLTYDLTAPEVQITAPTNDSVLNAGRFNVTLNENGSCLYSLDSGITNYSMSSANNQSLGAVNTTLVQNASHTVVYYCTDSAGNRNNSVGIAFSIDLTQPNVTLTSYSPSNGLSTTGSVALQASFLVSDNLNISSCVLLVNNATVQTVSNLTNFSQTYGLNATYSSVGSYRWSVNCTDTAGNAAQSSEQTFSITGSVVQDTGSGGGRGGGGGGGTGAPRQNQTNISNAQNNGEQHEGTRIIGESDGTPREENAQLSPQSDAQREQGFFSRARQTLIAPLAIILALAAAICGFVLFMHRWHTRIMP